MSAQRSDFSDTKTPHRSSSPFVLRNLSETEDPFSVPSNSPSTFIIRLQLHIQRGWPLANLRSDFEYINKFQSYDLQKSPLPSPTHKPRRARKPASPQRNNMASHNRGYVPPLHNRQLPTTIPQYITSEQMQNTDSTGSQDSVMTQLPLPYHIGGERVYGQQTHATYDFAALDQSSPFATPEILNQATFPEMHRHSSSGKLNPSSAPYYPGFPPSNNNNYGQQPVAYNTSFGSTATTNSGYQPPSQNSSTPTMSSGYSSSFSSQLNTVSSFSTPSPYGGGVPLGNTAAGHMNAPSASNGGIHFRNDYGMPAVSASYSQHGAGFDKSVEAARYNHPQTGFYLPAASPAMGYTTVGNTGMAYQSVGYGGPSVNNLSTNNAMSSSVPGWAEQQNIQYPVQPPASVYTNPANVNRGKPAHYFPNYSNNFYGKPTSNLATAPVVNATLNQKIVPHQSQLGGPVRPPSSKLTAPPSPSKSRNSVRTSASEHRCEVASDVGTGTGTVTPAAHITKHVEFQSEPRGTDTPTNNMLRSRRGQTISTDPKPNTLSWLEKVPAAMPRASPPKMSSLLASSSINPNTLPGINAADPFVSPSTGSYGLITPGKTNIFGPTTQLTPYSGGAAAARQSGPSPAVRALTANGTRKPTIGEVLDTKNLPLVEYCRMATEDAFGVIKIRNIPYSVARPEILAFLGRNARIISESDHEPVHIVMERVTSKTLDCYVEFVNFNEAVNAVNRFETNRSGGRGGRLGQRHVDVELSSQDQLMKDLFPKAKNVNWHGARPVILERDPNDQYNSGFQGFLSKEELVMLVKHVEAPQRSPFSKECPQRPFECLISTLLKYPWYMVDYITIEDRNLLHSATLQLIEMLKQRIENDTQDSNINSMLFKRVWRAALKCPGFSPSQKDDIVFIVGLDFGTALEFGVPPFAADWKDLWTIGPKPGSPWDLVYYYAALLREETSNKQQLSLAEKAAQGVVDTQPRLFGDLIKHIGLPWNREQLLHMTLAQVAAKEWAAIESVLKRALSGPRNFLE